MALTSFDQIRLHANRPASRPPSGSVDLFWDSALNGLAVIPSIGDALPVYEVGDTVPIQWKAAAGTLDPSGSNNNIVLTAPLDIGAAGNSLSAIILISSGVNNGGVDRYEISVTRVVNVISIICGLRNRVTVSGTLNSGIGSVTFGILTYGGYLNERPFFTNGGVSIEDSTHRVQWDGAQWIMSTGSSSWTSIHDVEPSSVSPGAWHETNNPNGWKPTSPATGTPVCAPATALASQVIAAINASDVGVSAANAAGNTGVGLMATATVNLTAGITGTSAPPQVRITNGKIYTFFNGLWYESASTLVV